ncbi:class I SAM-dependent methyltransferase [Prescottella soli]|uniref:Class I SAM-dependent methyltransferase n=1 Tax=Prescottella soli TaxID=1543852 RepID=A0ABW9FNW8_9NOCA
MIDGMENVGARTGDIVREAYTARSREYVDLFGSMTSTHPSDRTLVGSWAEPLTGPVLDAGCGPGQWTDFLTGCGVDASGIDLVPEFVDRARTRYPHLSFGLGSFETLDAGAESLGGVLAWYSLIHHRPQDIRIPLAEFARVIRPGGGLLVGFFEGPVVEPFDHAATTAYRWPVAELRRELATAGFEVIETHTRTGSGYRPHGAVTARRQNRDSRLVHHGTR